MRPPTLSCTPDPRTFSVPLSLKRRCDRTLGPARRRRRATPTPSSRARSVAAHPPHYPLTILYKSTANLEQFHLLFTTFCYRTTTFNNPQVVRAVVVPEGAEARRGARGRRPGGGRGAALPLGLGPSWSREAIFTPAPFVLSIDLIDRRFNVRSLTQCSIIRLSIEHDFLALREFCSSPFKRAGKPCSWLPVCFVWRITTCFF